MSVFHFDGHREGNKCKYGKNLFLCNISRFRIKCHWLQINNHSPEWVAHAFNTSTMEKEFEDSLDYIVTSRTARPTQRHTVSKNEQTNNNRNKKQKKTFTLEKWVVGMPSSLPDTKIM